VNVNWDDINIWLYGVASSLGALVIVLVRKVFTNEKQIELLKQQINAQEGRFTEFRNDLKEVRDDIKILIRDGRNQ
jgi:hypothetical protein